MKPRTGVLAAFVVALLAAMSMLAGSCGRRQTDRADDKAAKGRPDSLVAWVRLDAGSYALREPVVMTLTVRNTTGRTLRLTFPSAQRYDFLVRKDKRIIWQWAHDRMFAQVRGYHAIGPHDSVSYEETWPQTTDQGTEPGLGAYTVQGILKAVPEVASPEKRFGLVD